MKMDEKTRKPPSALADEDLLAATRTLVRRSNALTAELLAHLAEIDVRKLYLEQAQPSLFAWCVAELGCSEDVACNWIAVARASRRWPALLETLRRGQVHLSGLRLLVPHLREDNIGAVLSEAAGQSKRSIQELVARLAPQPPVASSIRRVPAPREPRSTVSPPASVLAGEAAADPSSRPSPAPTSPATEGRTAAPAPEAAGPLPLLAAPAAAPSPPSAVTNETRDEDGASSGAGPAAIHPGPAAERRHAVQPLSVETFKVTFTASRALRDKLKAAQDLLRHQIPDGDLAEVVDRALDLLLAEVKKERFGIGAQPRSTPRTTKPGSRHIPAAIRRAVYERDEGRCTYVDARGQRCPETGFLELDHVEGFAMNTAHTEEGICLRCHAHNQHRADQMYGRPFMDQVRSGQQAPCVPSRPAPHPPRGGSSTAASASAAVQPELLSWSRGASPGA